MLKSKVILKELSHLTHSFAGLNVVVIGEAILDSYLEGSTDRLCREAPVPVVAVSARKDIPGGAANTAVNIKGMGGQPLFLSVVGDDPEWNLLQQALEDRGVSTVNILIHPTRRTLAKHRVIAASQMLARFDQGNTDPVDSETEQVLINRLTYLFPRCDAVIVSDYGYGILTPRVIQILVELQAESPQVLVVDSRDLSVYRHVGVTAVKPNYNEAVHLLGIQALPATSLPDCDARADQIASHEKRLLDITGAQIAAVTLDTDGALLFQRDNPPYRTYAQPRPHSCAVGAGDTFVSALTLALAANAHIPAAAEIASAAAAIVVAKEGTSTCHTSELQEYITAA